jgi:hypothetical protein
MFARLSEAANALARELHMPPPGRMTPPPFTPRESTRFAERPADPQPDSAADAGRTAHDDKASEIPTDAGCAAGENASDLPTDVCKRPEPSSNDAGMTPEWDKTGQNVDKTRQHFFRQLATQLRKSPDKRAPQECQPRPVLSPKSQHADKTSTVNST